MEIIPIARVWNDFPQKFGLPRQPGVLCDIPAKIVFEKPWRDPNALRGLEGFERIWILWQFDRMGSGGFSPTVRPPKLGGNRRVGLFATRSPNRPNPIGLTCVRLERIGWDDPDGPVLHVLGADMRSGTPVLDIKPYLPFADAWPEAAAGFAGRVEEKRLAVRDPSSLLSLVPPEKLDVLRKVLSGDPRPAYRGDGGEYGVSYAGFNVRFSVAEDTLTILKIEPEKEDKTDDESERHCGDPQKTQL